MVNTTAVVSGECKRLFSRSNEVVISWVSCGSFSEPSVFYDENCGANSQFLVTCAGDCLISISGGAGDGVDWGCSTVGGSRSHYHVVTSQVNCLYENRARENFRQAQKKIRGEKKNEESGSKNRQQGVLIPFSNTDQD